MLHLLNLQQSLLYLVLVLSFDLFTLCFTIGTLLMIRLVTDSSMRVASVALTAHISRIMTVFVHTYLAERA